MKKITVKDAFESGNVVITKIQQGSDGNVRIDAKARFTRPDGDNFLSKWVKRSYAEKLYGKSLSEHPKFYY